MELEWIYDIDEDQYKAIFSNLIVRVTYPLIYEEFFVQLFEDSNTINFSLTELEYFHTQFHQITITIQKTHDLYRISFQILNAIRIAMLNKKNLYIVR